MILLIFACASGLVALAFLQLSWIGAARDSRRIVATSEFRATMRDLEASLRLDAAQLLMLFRADPVLDAQDPGRALMERYEFWTDSVPHSASLRRVMIFDLPGPNGRGTALRELDTGSGRMRPADWSRELSGLEGHLLEAWPRRGQSVSSRWFATWLAYPEHSVVARPMMMPPRRPGNSPRVRGQLVLQLDLEYLAERILLPRLGRDFAGLGGDGSYEVALIWSGEMVRVFKRAPAGTAGRDSGLGPARAAYVLGPQRRVEEVPWLANPDWRHTLASLDGRVPQTAVERGATQRVALGLDPAMVPESFRPTARPSPNTLGFASAVPIRPRVFVVSPRHHRLELAAHRVSESLDEALAHQYWWHLLTSLGVLSLLTIAIVLVATGARRASRLARMRMAFVANVSHELRSPVASMRLIGENIADGLVGKDGRLVRYGELVRDQAKRLSEMIEDTLLFSRIESGQEAVVLRRVDVPAVVDAAIAEVRPRVERAGFVLERAVRGELPAVPADKNALRQSITNLLTNAVNHASEGLWLKVEVTLVATESGPEVQVRVHDRGPGIEQSEIGRIFEPYYRSHRAVRNAVPGSGLGLSLARDLVRMMGGRLTAKAAVGQGSVFKVHLPVAD